MLADVLSKSDKNVDFNILLEHLNPFLGDDAKAVVTKLYKALSGERDSDGIPLALGGGVRSKKIKIVVRNLSYDCDEERLKGFLEHAGCKTWTVDILKDDEGKGRGIAFCEVEERGEKLRRYHLTTIVVRDNSAIYSIHHRCIILICRFSSLLDSLQASRSLRRGPGSLRVGKSGSRGRGRGSRRGVHQHNNNSNSNSSTA